MSMNIFLNSRDATNGIIRRKCEDWGLGAGHARKYTQTIMAFRSGSAVQYWQGWFNSFCETQDSINRACATGVQTDFIRGLIFG